MLGTGKCKRVLKNQQACTKRLHRCAAATRAASGWPIPLREVDNPHKRKSFTVDGGGVYWASRRPTVRCRPSPRQRHGGCYCHCYTQGGGIDVHPGQPTVLGQEGQDRGPDAGHLCRALLTASTSPRVRPSYKQRVTARPPAPPRAPQPCLRGSTRTRETGVRSDRTRARGISRRGAFAASRC